MKTIKNLLFVAFAAMTISACQKEFDSPDGGQQNSGKMVTFTGSMAQVDTRTMIQYEDAVDGKLTPRFGINDDRFIVNGIKSDQLTKEDELGTVISFSVPDLDEGPYYAMSAVQYEAFDPDTKTYSLLVSGTGRPQEYYKVSGGKKTSYHPKADILAAYSGDETMTFKHMSTFFAITIDMENSTVKDNIKNIYIRQGDGGKIAGTWSLKFNEDNQPYLEPKSLSAPIGYDCVTKDFSPEGLPQGEGNVAIVGIPAYNYENGLIITIKDVNGKFASYKIGRDATQFASQGGVIIPFNPAFNPQSRTIETAEDWNAFAECINSAKNDWDLYTWIGDGTVKLGDDITAETLTPINVEFPYVFDGNGKTITINNASRPLFDTVSGEIKGLTIAGNMVAEIQNRNNFPTVLGSPFVGVLQEGGKVTDCTNKMNVSVGTAEVPVDAHVYATGFVSAMYAGTVSGCVNEGTVDVYVNASVANHNVAVAGIVGDIRFASEGKAVIQGCTNSQTADITLTPKSAASGHSFGMAWCGVGGIAAVLRGAIPLELIDCDNSAEVTVSGKQIVDVTGLVAKTIAVGGILGLASPVSSGIMAKPENIDTPYDVTLKSCDNSGVVYNCATNYAATKGSQKLVFTGGLVGAVIGSDKKYTKVHDCSNTGDVKTYDYTGDTASKRPNFCMAAGGLIGYGGYLDINGATVRCHIGSRERQMVACGGVIGFTVRPFTLKSSTVDVTGHFASYSGYDDNCAVIAVVPVKCGTAAMDIVPDVAGSEISNNTTISAYLNTLSHGTSTTDAQVTTSLSSAFEANTVIIDTVEEIAAKLVCGEGFTANTGITIGDGTTDNNTYIAGTAN